MSTRALCMMAALLTACSGDAPEPAADATIEPGSQGNSPPTAQTQAANRAAGEALDLGDDADFDAADRGLLAREPEVVVEMKNGRRIWDTAAYAFEEGEAPPSVNPSLWRQAQLNNRHGLYEVVDGVYQVRGYDLSNMSLIRGKTGWIVVDPLTSQETAAAAMTLVRKHLGDDPIVAVIVTHSHLDHFGGIASVASQKDVASGKVRVIAPAKFVEEATSENVLAGIAMGRRASFMYGTNLERSPMGHVGSGLGKAPATGTFGLLPPTDIIDHTPQPMEIDGVRFVFQYAPESEAPAELMFYLPDQRVLCSAEVVTRNMHNLYTLRGAKVRDALKWSGYIHEAIRLFGDVEVLVASHHWPTWGNQEIISYLEGQRDTYKYIHDQTLRLANRGYTPREIAEAIELPPSLARTFGNRGYYGTVRHNAKAVYQWYFGWYDGNPAHLNALPPVEAATRYVEFMGGGAAVPEKAQASFDSGEYRWVATVLDHLVFAEPENQGARDLLARAYDQLGYQAESGPWRDVYLTAALELRGGKAESPLDLSAALDLLRHTPVARFFDAMAARIKAEDAEDMDLTLNFVFTDIGKSFVLSLKNSVLNHVEAEPDPEADVTVEVTRELWLRLTIGQANLREMLFSDDLAVKGSRLDLVSFFRLIEQPDTGFAIVTP